MILLIFFSSNSSADLNLGRMGLMEFESLPVGGQLNLRRISTEGRMSGSRKPVIVSNTHHFDEVESNLCHSGSDNKTQRH